jgi:hypothetical protein
LGYWYFPQYVSLPQCLVAGRKNAIQIAWQNRGTAPAFQRFYGRFSDPEKTNP